MSIGQESMLLDRNSPVEHRRNSMTGTRTSWIVTADQTNLFVRDWGEGPAIVFVHSWSMNADLWQYQMRALSERGFRTIAYDARGHGRSQDPGRGFDVDTMVDDLRCVVEGLGLEKVMLVGHSNGCGQIVRYTARFGASRVSRIALLGTTTPKVLRSADNLAGLDPEILEQVLARWETDLHGWVAENTDPFFVPGTPETMKHWLWSLVWQTALKAQIETNRSFLYADFRDDARAIGVRTLILHGTADASAPVALTAQPTAELIRGSRLEIYENAPHGFLLTDPGRVNQDLYDFFSQTA